MSRDLAESHQAVGRSWLIRTRPVELLTRRHGDCIQLEARIRRARRELGSARSDGLQQALVEIESDLGTYVGLLAEREAHLGWVGPLRSHAVAVAHRDDIVSLGAAITEFVQRSRGDLAEAERLGDPESAGMLAEMARVAETWLWDLADDRKRVELGTITLAAVAPNDELQTSLTFNPTYLTLGIPLSDDPFVRLRSACSPVRGASAPATTGTQGTRRRARRRPLPLWRHYMTTRTAPARRSAQPASSRGLGLTPRREPPVPDQERSAGGRPHGGGRAAQPATRRLHRSADAVQAGPLEREGARTSSRCTSCSTRSTRMWRSTST